MSCRATTSVEWTLVPGSSSPFWCNVQSLLAVASPDGDNEAGVAAMSSKNFLPGAPLP
jgi:hypothetical protein